MQSNRPAGGARRLGVLVGPVLIGAVVLSSCGGSDSGATQSTIDLSAASTAFVVRPPATTVAPASTEAGDPTATVEGTQEYTVQAGDYPYLLVERFAITLEDLVAVNEWADANQFPPPGTVILIPPGALSVDAVAAGETATETDTATDPTDTTADEADDATTAATIPDAGDNCAPGSYTLVDGDVPIKVAEKFDVTVEALNAANAATPGYSAFYVGLEIVIPAKSDC